MSVRSCPTCRHDTTRAFLGASQSSQVNYYGCDHCGCVWTAPTVNPYDVPPTVVLRGKAAAAAITAGPTPISI